MVKRTFVLRWKIYFVIHCDGTWKASREVLQSIMGTKAWSLSERHEVHLPRRGWPLQIPRFRHKWFRAKIWRQATKRVHCQKLNFFVFIVQYLPMEHLQISHQNYASKLCSCSDCVLKATKKKWMSLKARKVTF